MNTLLSILILNFNTKDITLSCINSIIKYYKKQIESGEIEIVVGDNASKDDSSFLRKKISDSENIFIFKNQENLGFAKGINLLSKNAKGKYFLLLNSDTEFCDSQLLKATEFLENNSKAGVLGLKMTDKDGSLQLSAGKFYNLGNIFLMLFKGERFGVVRFSPKNIQEVDWVCGGAFIIRKNLFEKLKGFDENFFMYVEDMELCFRVRKSGYKTYFYPYSKVIHKEHGSANRAYAILNIYKGILYFYKKHKSILAYVLIKSLFKLKAIFAVLIGNLVRSSYLVNTYLKILRGI